MKEVTFTGILIIIFLSILYKFSLLPTQGQWCDFCDMRSDSKTLMHWNIYGGFGGCNGFKYMYCLKWRLFKITTDNCVRDLVSEPVMSNCG